MSNDIKVTDKRIFTPDGALREEYRFLDEKSTAVEADAGEETAPAPPPAPAAPTAPAAPAPEPARGFAPAPPGYDEEPGFGPGPEAGYGFEPAPGAPPGLGAPTFFDLVAMLAEPVAVYLGDVPLPDGQDAENLEMARLHIDLIDTLRQKTAGNLDGQESAFLEDLLYRLKVRYVQKRR